MQRSSSLKQTVFLLFAFLCLVNLATAVSALPPMANFTRTPTSGLVPLVVQFTNISTNSPSGRAWFFGDENWTLPIMFKPLRAGFNMSNASGNSPLEVQFTNNCVGYSDSKHPLTFLWDFGDGTSSTDINPTHTFVNEGNHTIRLIVSNIFCSLSSTGTVQVNRTPVFHSNWQYNIVGNVTNQQNVVDAINAAHIPTSVNFTYNPGMPIRYSGWNDAIWPSPDVDFGMVVVDADMIPNINFDGGSDGNRFIVARKSVDDEWTLGNRIWHEISHSMGLNSDMLDWQTEGNDCDKFCNYVSSDPKWNDDAEIKIFCANKSYDYITDMVLKAYYTMLWKHAGFPLTPTVSTLNVSITTENEYTRNTPVHWG